MSQTKADVPLLAELSEEEREVAMVRYRVIAPLLAEEHPAKEKWRQAAEQGGCSEKTIRRWVNQFQRAGLAGLARKRRQDKGQRRRVSPEVQRLIEALYLEHSHRSLQTVHRLIQSHAEQEELPVPSYTTVRDICLSLSPSVVAMARKGEHAWRDEFEPVTRFESTRPNECWQMDHCLIDLQVVDETRENVLGRPWLTLALDTYSRAVTGYYLSLTTPSSLAICFALRWAILAKPHPAWPVHGIPERLHIDRGKDFISKHLRQVAADLDIQISVATAYLPRAKGKVERFFGTLNQQVWCELPGYVGSTIQDRPPLVQPSLTLQEAESYLLAYLVNRYHQQPHTTTGEAPLVRWQQPDFVPRLPTTARELDLLLLFTEERIVQRDGIRFYHLDYWDHQLVDHIGYRVQVRYDPEHIRAIVIYRDRQFVCIARARQLDGVDINLADWRALQARHRRSIQAVVTSYRQWLETKRSALVPILSPAEVDLAILTERTLTARNAEEPALFPSDRNAALPPPEPEASHA